MSQLIEISPEYVYVTVPAEYICVYHRILAMLADYGEEMLKDCKASCTDKNSGVIECFNMFNAAVAARKLGKDKLAETLIKYVKAKINQIYGGRDNSTSFVFPVDPDGRIKAFVSCGELPKFEINPDDGELYEHESGNGFDEHFKLGPEDEPHEYVDPEEEPEYPDGLYVKLTPSYEARAHLGHAWFMPCAEIIVAYNGEILQPSDYVVDKYFDNVSIDEWSDIHLESEDQGTHNFKVAVIYEGNVAMDDASADFNIEPNEEQV